MSVHLFTVRTQSHCVSSKATSQPYIQLAVYIHETMSIVIHYYWVHQSVLEVNYLLPNTKMCQDDHVFYSQKFFFFTVNWRGSIHTIILHISCRNMVTAWIPKTYDYTYSTYNQEVSHTTVRLFIHDFLHGRTHQLVPWYVGMTTKITQLYVTH